MLAQCLAGDPIHAKDMGNVKKPPNNMNNNNMNMSSNQHPHIERLTLVDCGITRTSCVKTLTNALSEQPQSQQKSSMIPKVLTTLDVSRNKFGDGGAKLLQKLTETNPKITSLGMVGCNVNNATYLKTMADRLRYNNSFLQKMGFSSNVSLAILDSVSTMEHVFGSGSGSGSTSKTTTAATLSSSTTTTTTTTTTPSVDRASGTTMSTSCCGTTTNSSINACGV